MSLAREELNRLAAKLMEGTISPSEQQTLNKWLNEQMMKDSYDIDTSFATDSEDLRRRMLEHIINTTQNAETRRTRYPLLLPLVSIAAAVVLLIFGGIWFFTGQPQTGKDPVNVLQAQDIGPGENKAILTIGNGQAIQLNQNQDGIFIADEITYADGSLVSNAKDQMMSLTTSRGGNYKVTLPDGSEAWLNASSTLKYPRHFSGNERIVELSGEAYFSVRKSKSQSSFKVRSAGQTVEVLGTQFNVAAYPEERAVFTTLIEGSVRLSAAAVESGVSLLPDEQGVFLDGKLTKAKVDVSSVIAWREDLFAFDGLPPEIAFAQLGRWYDLDISYRGSMPQTRFFGIIERNKPLGSILKVLEKSGVKFEVQQKNGRNQLIVIGE